VLDADIAPAALDQAFQRLRVVDVIFDAYRPAGQISYLTMVRR